MGYYWKAIYNDGTELSQVNPDGSSNKYTDIDRTKLVRFVLLQLGNDEPSVVLHLGSERRLIYRRRVAQEVFTGKKTIVYLVGWQQTIKDVNSQMICFVFADDGHIEVTDSFKERGRWFYPVNFLPEEQS